MNDEQIKLMSNLAITSVTTIYDKVTVIKNQKDEKKCINELGELINSLIDEREEIIRLTKRHEEELLNRKIKDEDLEYIVNTIIPIIEEHIGSSEQLENIKSLLSIEMINVLQLIGFNVKEAIGIPLTSLVASKINQQQGDEEVNKLTLENEVKFKELLLNEDTRELAKKVYNID